MASIRETDNRVFGIVGRDWTPVQNEDSFAWFDGVVSDGRASFETAGALHGGRIVWVLAKLADSFEVVPGDAVKGYLLLSNAHDGTRSVQARFTPIRVVCANTLGAADRGDARLDRAISIRHTSGVAERMEQAAHVMGLASRQLESTADAFRLIAGVQLGVARAREYFESVVDGTRDELGNLSPRSANVVKVLGELFDGAGVGLDMPGVRGTAWGAYNAVTEYVDYQRGASKGADARLDSIAFGSGLAMKQRALSLALAAA
jgi:phage/plasmid-like protein (TIGR03299 family)